jgi:hypothetical protein
MYCKFVKKIKMKEIKLKGGKPTSPITKAVNLPKRGRPRKMPVPAFKKE